MLGLLLAECGLQLDQPLFVVLGLVHVGIAIFNTTEKPRKA